MNTHQCPNCGHKIAVNNIFASVGGNALLKQKGPKYFSDLAKRRWGKKKPKNGRRNKTLSSKSSK